ncbi:hypothetical protein L5515_018567 [Caenorhabditis briggsae]|uniref:Uncharacterized protein n=1 Tax=Caenorhabditis briggsae TaxID=6238 RepID=A0AAE9FJS1_CAEBR|nr:hypothetical protein L5515_018567 [Caenorhabditis briggsae]
MFSMCIIGDCIRFISRCDLLLTGFLFLLAIVNFFMRLQFLDRWMHKTKLLVKQIRLVRKNSKKVLMELPFLIEDMTTIRELYKYIKDFTENISGLLLIDGLMRNRPSAVINLKLFGQHYSFLVNMLLSCSME